MIRPKQAGPSRLERNVARYARQLELADHVGRVTAAHRLDFAARRAVTLNLGALLVQAGVRLSARTQSGAIVVRK